jgi:hypothetical protein
MQPQNPTTAAPTTTTSSSSAKTNQAVLINAFGTLKKK